MKPRFDEQGTPVKQRRVYVCLSVFCPLNAVQTPFKCGFCLLSLSSSSSRVRVAILISFHLFFG